MTETDCERIRNIMLVPTFNPPMSGTTRQQPPRKQPTPAAAPRHQPISHAALAADDHLPAQRFDEVSGLTRAMTRSRYGCHAPAPASGRTPPVKIEMIHCNSSLLNTSPSPRD